MCDAAAREAKTARTVVVDMQAEIDQHEKRLVDLRRMILTATENATEREGASARRLEDVQAIAKEWAESLQRRDEIDAQLASADAHNRLAVEAEVAAKRRTEASDAIDKLESQRAKQTEMLDKIEAQKVAFLSAAALPIEGLGVAPAGITLNGVPFDQASGAERLRVAVSLAMAAASELDDILIRDASLIDDEMMDLVGELAEKAGKRCWLERVGTRDPGVIVIADGMVAP